MKIAKPEIDRFVRKFDYSDGCWEWKGYRTPFGYGMFYTAAHRLVLAHRWFYEWCYGDVPKSLQMDHLCRNPSCVNPDHLEPVTPRENVMRSDGVCAANAAKTHCPKGHPLDGENLLLIDNGGPRKARKCRRCAYDATMRYQKRRRRACKASA